MSLNITIETPEEEKLLRELHVELTYTLPFICKDVPRLVEFYTALKVALTEWGMGHDEQS